ncbi:FAD-dependent oxidoreductase [Rhizobium leguminosarum]|uniref:FAD-dependent oxidoreductase n=1 Tax=Rhizobium leguminosarum TaxID=384 RepID=A0A7K3VR34_RHILE|nr:FAD-dependent oxidoreductase [Rhizobium leguminosarum]NEK18978.1 FAD-dependent oxidoreductase [Rhizobium leguminosarum]
MKASQATASQLPSDHLAKSAPLPVVIIGAGPIGLAAAAHLLERGLTPLILERGDDVGSAIQDWRHVSMFSPWRFNIDTAARSLLEWHGWEAPESEGFPTGADLIELYLKPLSKCPEIAPHIRFGALVTNVGRANIDKARNDGRTDAPLEIRVTRRDGADERLFARAVIDATGTSLKRSPAGAGGMHALGEKAASERIFYGMPDILGEHRARYGGKHVAVVGSGHSAVGALLELVELSHSFLEMKISWILRRSFDRQVFGGGAADQLRQRGSLGLKLEQQVADGRVCVVAPLAIEEIATDKGASLVIGGDSDGQPVNISADELIVVTGLRPDLSFLDEIRLDLDPALECPRALAPLIDPNVHKCGTVRPHGAFDLAQPEPGFFIVGMKSYGRAPTFLLATGYEQVRSTAAWLCGDLDGARRVELTLPETGICGGKDADDNVCCASEKSLARCCA